MTKTEAFEFRVRRAIHTGRCVPLPTPWDHETYACRCHRWGAAVEHVYGNASCTKLPRTTPAYRRALGTMTHALSTGYCLDANL